MRFRIAEGYRQVFQDDSSINAAGFRDKTLVTTPSTAGIAAHW
ncbi:MAG: hypothetical protein ABSD59_09730 [Terracidiphilus sp.]